MTITPGVLKVLVNVTQYVSPTAYDALPTFFVKNFATLLHCLPCMIVIDVKVTSWWIRIELTCTRKPALASK